MVTESKVRRPKNPPLFRLFTDDKSQSRGQTFGKDKDVGFPTGNRRAATGVTQPSPPAKPNMRTGSTPSISSPADKKPTRDKAQLFTNIGSKKGGRSSIPAPGSLLTRANESARPTGVKGGRSSLGSDTGPMPRPVTGTGPMPRPKAASGPLARPNGHAGEPGFRSTTASPPNTTPKASAPGAAAGSRAKAKPAEATKKGLDPAAFVRPTKKIENNQQRLARERMIKASRKD